MMRGISPLLLLVFCLLSLPVWADCGFRTGLTAVDIVSVTDGDTFRRADGKRLRLVSVNTPELARDSVPAEPLANTAKEHVRAFVDKADTLYWREAPDRTDRYGRLLGELYNREGQSLSAALLREGLGFYIAVGALPDWWACLRRAEDEARDNSEGVWQEDYYRPRRAGDLNRGDAGFRRIHGRVQSIETAAGAIWIELDGPVVIKLEGGGEGAEAWRGRELEVAAWLVDRTGSRAHQRGHKPLLMVVGDSSALRFDP